jgi:hypothetical protein
MAYFMDVSKLNEEIGSIPDSKDSVALFYRSLGSFLWNLPLFNLHIWNQADFFGCQNRLKNDVTICLNCYLINRLFCKAIIIWLN